MNLNACPFILCLVALCFFILTVAHAETPRERAERALDQPTKIELVDTPVKDVFRHLSQLHGVPIEIVQEGPEAGHLYGTAPLTRYLSNVSLRSALNLMLDRLLMDYRVTPQGEILIIAAQPNAKARRPISKVQDAAFARNFRLLETKVVSLEFVDTPLRDILGYLSDEVGVQFVLDEEALDAVGLQPDSPMTRNLQNLPLHKAMTGFLYEYGLRVALRNEVFYITKIDSRIPRREIPEYLHKLAAKSVEIEFADAPLVDAIIHMANELDYPLIIHRRVEAAGIDFLKLTVTTPRRRLPAKDAFRKILEPHNLRVMVYDEMLFITPIRMPPQSPQVEPVRP